MGKMSDMAIDRYKAGQHNMAHESKTFTRATDPATGRKVAIPNPGQTFRRTTKEK